MADDGDDGTLDESDSIDDLPSDDGPIGGAARPFLSGPGRFSAPTPIFEPTKSTALEDDEPQVDPSIPPSALWVMRYRRHRMFRRGDDDGLRRTLGHGDERAYVSDDGEDHVMVTRLVGRDRLGVEFFLVGRMRLDDYHSYMNGFKEVGAVFSDAKDLALCSVYAAPQAVSNVTLVERYRKLTAVPSDYLPPNPVIEFDDDDDGDGDGDDEDAQQ